MKKKVLYKYFGDNRNFFTDRLVRFSPRNALNDPFEVRPSVEAYARYLKANTSARHRTYDEFYNVVKESHYKLFQERFGAKTLNSLGALCLTESKRSLLMWSHYASAHKGYVVGFDATHSFFNDQNCWPHIDGVGSVKPVKYDSYRPSSVDCYTEWYFQKSDEWMYEKEHRLLLPLENSDVVLKFDDNGGLSENIDINGMYFHKSELGGSNYLCLFEVPKEALVSVTFGAAMGHKLRLQIEHSIRGLDSLKKENANYSENRFELDII